jgi:hypothetical protein
MEIAKMFSTFGDIRGESGKDDTA